MFKSSPAMFAYHQKLQPIRASFFKSPGALYFATENHKKRLHGFLMLWSAHSITMTKNVEQWIKMAGQRCEDLGLKTIGESLKSHAKHEAGHDQMLVKDLDLLVNLWNKIHGGAISTQELLKIELPANSYQYVKLHEEIIASKQPYAQVAVEYEIERLSVAVAPRWIENAIYTLGLEFVEGVSFLEEHILLDQGHTKFNTILMEKCFSESLGASALIEAGSEALKCYAGFLNECVQQTEKLFGGA